MPNCSTTRFPLLLILCLSALLVGCQQDEPVTEEKTSSSPQDAPMPVAPAIDGSQEISVATLRRQLGANSNAQFQKAGGRIVAASLANSGVKDLTPLQGLPLKALDLTFLNIKDISPLEGMPLMELYLEGTQVEDISPLSGMSLEVLRMEHTPVKDISPLAGMKIRQLNLYGTQVESIEAVRQMPLHTLWITETNVTDLAPLAGIQFESLDIEKTPVSDLTPISGNLLLKRLNIAGSNVTDLTPLKGLNLERLIFNADKIEQGMEVLLSMPSLQSLGESFDTVMPAAQFWAQWQTKDKSTSTSDANTSNPPPTE